MGASSPVAGVVEVHEMRTDGDIMRMRAVPALVLPRGKTVQLKSCGYHLMLMDLKQPVAKDSKVALTLRPQDSHGTQTTQKISVPVSTVAAGRAGEKTPKKCRARRAFAMS